MQNYGWSNLSKHKSCCYYPILDKIEAKSWRRTKIVFWSLWMKYCNESWIHGLSFLIINSLFICLLEVQGLVPISSSTLSKLLLVLSWRQMIFFMTKELPATRNVQRKICSYVIFCKPHEKYESCQANNVRRPQPRKY